MKKSLSYLLPVAAILILAILAFRWLNTSSDANKGVISPSAEGIEISDLTNDEMSPVGVADMETIKLSSPAENATPSSGEIRYAQDENDKTRFTVFADVPEIKNSDEFYQLWFKGDKGLKKAMRLALGKGGYIGEGALTSEFDQVDVIISKEKVDDDVVEEIMLEGNLNLKKVEEL